MRLKHHFTSIYCIVISIHQAALFGVWLQVGFLAIPYVEHRFILSSLGFSFKLGTYFFPTKMEWPTCMDEYEKLVIRMSNPRYVVSQLHSLFFVFFVIYVILLLPLIMWFLEWFLVFSKSYHNLFVYCSSFFNLSQNPIFL